MDRADGERIREPYGRRQRRSGMVARNREPRLEWRDGERRRDAHGTHPARADRARNDDRDGAAWLVDLRRVDAICGTVRDRERAQANGVGASEYSSGPVVQDG